MRCCLLTLALAEEDAVLDGAEGGKLACRYCSTTMIVREGAWEWDKSAAPRYGTVPMPPEAELA